MRSQTPDDELDLDTQELDDIETEPLGFGPGEWASAVPVRQPSSAGQHEVRRRRANNLTRVARRKRLTLRLPTFGFIVATRATLAFGVGLLVSTKLPEQRRRAIGLACVAFGVATTVPAVMAVAGHIRRE
jgi:hypothetical protein